MATFEKGHRETEQQFDLLGERIRRARKQILELTQTEFAARLGTTQSNVAKWESGRYSPSPAQLVDLAKLLEGNQESLYFYEAAGIPLSLLGSDSEKGGDQ